MFVDTHAHLTFPEFADVHRENFTFERRDGVTIHGRVAMPVGWREGDGKVPAVFWTYPSEYNTVDDYERSKLRGLNVNRHPRLSMRSNSGVWRMNSR